VLEEKRQIRLKRDLGKVKYEIGVLENKAALCAQQSGWVRKKAVSEVDPEPPRLDGLERETAFAMLRAFPKAATLGAMLMAPAWYSFSQLVDPSARPELFKVLVEIVGVISLAKAAFMVKNRSRRFLSDVESQITERLESLYGKRLALEKKLGFVVEGT
jgi:hypothetical protein